MSGYRIIAFSGYKLPAAYTELVYSRWLRSLRFGNDYFKLIKSNAYYEAYHRYIQRVLEHPDSMVRLGVLSDDADVVLGFSVSRGSILDYVHVHKDHRRLGIGTKLVPQGIDTITHLTRTGLAIFGSKHFNWAFNPFV
jgi:GNAT superfamily N-acetyltransferase